MENNESAQTSQELCSCSHVSVAFYFLCQEFVHEASHIIEAFSDLYIFLLDDRTKAKKLTGHMDHKHL